MIDRRSFLMGTAGVLLPVHVTSGQAAPLSPSSSLPRHPAAPLFCLAYVTPDAPGQGGQEPMVAKYPIAIVPQEDRYAFRRWRDRVRAINPGIILLGYQMVHEETAVPGPGHDELRKSTGSWCSYPGGFEPYTNWGNSHHRLYDPRSPSYSEHLLRACRAVLASYPYDGLFLDNCTIFPIANPLPSVRADMRHALQAILLQLRAEFRQAIFIANSSENWSGVNGEMNEGRPQQMEAELASFSGHAEPQMDMYQTILKDPSDTETLRTEMAKVHALGGYYGANVDSTRVLWFEEFERVVDSYKTRPS